MVKFEKVHNTNRAGEQLCFRFNCVTVVSVCESLPIMFPKKYERGVRNPLFIDPKSNFLSLFFNQKIEKVWLHELDTDNTRKNCFWLWLFCRIAKENSVAEEIYSSELAGCSPAEGSEYCLCHRCGQQLPSPPSRVLIHCTFLFCLSNCVIKITQLYMWVLLLVWKSNKTIKAK